MSLLDGGSGYDPCRVFLEETRIDADGNTLVVPSSVGITTKARFQPISLPGTNADLVNSTGYNSLTTYSMLLTRSFTAEYGVLGGGSVVEWGVDALGRPARYVMAGEARHYGNSRLTRHIVYTIKRS